MRVIVVTVAITILFVYMKTIALEVIRQDFAFSSRLGYFIIIVIVAVTSEAIATDIMVDIASAIAAVE